MFKYYNNGVQAETIADDYIAQNGEYLSSSVLTQDQLRSVFPNYPITEAQYNAWLVSQGLA